MRQTTLPQPVRGYLSGTVFTRAFFFLPHQIQYVPGVRVAMLPESWRCCTPGDAVDALVELIKKKTTMYPDLHQKENLDELYLFAYYNKDLMYNTPSLPPGSGSAKLERSPRV